MPASWGCNVAFRKHLSCGVGLGNIRRFWIRVYMVLGSGSSDWASGFPWQMWLVDKIVVSALEPSPEAPIYWLWDLGFRV